MEKKGNLGFIILLAIIAVLTLIIAFLAGLLFLNYNSTEGESGTAVETTNSKPDIEELFKIELFDKQMFNCKRDASNETSIVQLSAKLVCYKNKDQKKTEETVNMFTDEIIEMIGLYFSDLLKEEIETREFKLKIKDDLVTKINEMIKDSSKKVTSDLVYDIVFNNFLVP